MIKDGLIADVGAGVAVPAGARVIDGAGLTVYPGLIDADSVIGLREVPGVTPSDDYSEIGEITRSCSPSTPSITTAPTWPSTAGRASPPSSAARRGGMLPGQASIMDLAGSTVGRHGGRAATERSSSTIRSCSTSSAGAYQRVRRPFLDRRPAPRASGSSTTSSRRAQIRPAEADRPRPHAARAQVRSRASRARGQADRLHPRGQRRGHAGGRSSSRRSRSSRAWPSSAPRTPTRSRPSSSRAA